MIFEIQNAFKRREAAVENIHAIKALLSNL